MTKKDLVAKLKAKGVKQPAVVVDEAKRAGILVCSGLAMMELEAGIPQNNVFGHDPGGAFPGEKVTKKRVAAMRSSGQANGVGWTQLTYPPLVALADRMGGAHIPRYQMRVGFNLLREHFNTFGTLYQMFRAYNGVGPAAENYAIQALGKREKWRKITKE